jgi:NADH:ubiquinone oxidoreductase subunit
MGWFNRIFVWWENATPGTLLMTWRRGHFVGQDNFGNRYYSSEPGKRRWVIYSGTVEASRVPPEWHGWLHHTFDLPPTEEPLKRKSWELEHEPNLTGMPQAWHPEGSLSKDGKRPPATGDYEAWQPR